MSDTDLLPVMYSVMVTGREKIGPAEAAIILQFLSPRQRRLSPAKVRKYAKEMQEGKWKDTGEAIILDWHGRLHDGRHRLQAVVLSGATIEFVVVRGADPDSFDKVDIGHRRTTAQFIEGPYGNAIAGAARIALVYQKTQGTLANIGHILKDDVDIPDSLAHVDEHPYLYDLAPAIKEVHRACRLHEATHLAVLHLALLGGSPRWTVDEWLSALISGALLSPTDSRLKLREHWRDHHAKLNSKSADWIPVRFTLIAKMWNAYVLRQPVLLVKYQKGEAVPSILRHPDRQM